MPIDRVHTERDPARLSDREHRVGASAKKTAFEITLGGVLRDFQRRVVRNRNPVFFSLILFYYYSYAY